MRVSFAFLSEWLGRLAPPLGSLVDLVEDVTFVGGDDHGTGTLVDSLAGGKHDGLRPRVDGLVPSVAVHVVIRDNHCGFPFER